MSRIESALSQFRTESALSRRRALKTAGAVAALSSFSFPALAQSRPFKVGYVSPQSGPLAPFGEPDKFTIATAGKILAKGVQVGGKIVPVSLLIRDSQSDPNRAADVATDLILNEKIDLMVVASTPETANSVSDQCELNGVPCISTMVPWQPWFFGRNGNPDTGFKYTYHFFWGLEDIIASFTGMWDAVSTDKIVGGLFPNDGDGNAWGDPKLGLPQPLLKAGYKLIDPGRFQDLNDNFTSQINAFQSAKADIVTGVIIPPDVKTFWTQARQQGMKPKVVTIGKALLFPSTIETLGDSGNNMSSEAWWTPSFPFKSSLTGQSARQLADEYEATAKKQWAQPIGFAHAVIELAADVLKRSNGPGDSAGILDAVTKTRLDTIVGPVSWIGGKGPFKNISKTPLVGGQWRLGGKGSKYKYELVVVENKAFPNIPAGGTMQAMA